MRSSLAAVLVGLVAAGGVLAFVQLGRPAAFEGPPDGALHVRPLEAKALVQAEFPEQAGWRFAAWELTLGGPGEVTLHVADRAAPLREDRRNRTAGRELVAVGVRSIAPDEVRARYPQELTAEEARLEQEGQGDVRGFYELRLVRDHATDGREVIDLAIPRASSPPYLAEIGSARWAPAQEERGFKALRTGERLAVQDWVTMSRMFKPFERAFTALPDEVGVDGIPRPLADHTTPVWRVALEWRPTTTDR